MQNASFTSSVTTVGQIPSLDEMSLTQLIGVLTDYISEVENNIYTLEIKLEDVLTPITNDGSITLKGNMPSYSAPPLHMKVITLIERIQQLQSVIVKINSKVHISN